jgi:hypothetical protein
MPYKSQAQERYFNSPAGKAKVGPATVAEFNKASKGMKLPKKAKGTKGMAAVKKAAGIGPSGKSDMGSVMESLVG